MRYIRFFEIEHRYPKVGKVSMSLFQPRVAVLGGSFDPPTDGHLSVAANTLLSENVDEVWFMPCGRRPDKSSLKTSTFDRIIMCHLAVNSRFSGDVPVKVCDLEFTAPEDSDFIPTYIAYKKLVEQHPDKEISFLIGSDLLPNLKRFQYGQQVWEEIPFFVYPRPGYATEGLPPKAVLLESPAGIELCTSNVSSSEIRRRIAGTDGIRSIQGMTPLEVVNHIQREGLYANDLKS